MSKFVISFCILWLNVSIADDPFAFHVEALFNKHIKGRTFNNVNFESISDLGKPTYPESVGILWSYLYNYLEYYTEWKTNKGNYIVNCNVAIEEGITHHNFSTLSITRTSFSLGQLTYGEACWMKSQSRNEDWKELHLSNKSNEIETIAKTGEPLPFSCDAHQLQKEVIFMLDKPNDSDWFSNMINEYKRRGEKELEIVKNNYYLGNEYNAVITLTLYAWQGDLKANDHESLIDFNITVYSSIFQSQGESIAIYSHTSRLHYLSHFDFLPSVQNQSDSVSSLERYESICNEIKKHYIENL